MNSPPLLFPPSGPTLTPYQVMDHLDVANSWAKHPEFLRWRQIVERTRWRGNADETFSVWFWHNVPRVFAFVAVPPERVPSISATLLELRCDPEPCERARQIMARRYRRGGFTWTREDSAVFKVVCLLVTLWVLARSSEAADA